MLTDSAQLRQSAAELLLSLSLSTDERFDTGRLLAMSAEFRPDFLGIDTSLDIARRQHLPAAVSCLCRDTAVRFSVVRPFLWPAWRPGTRYQTTSEIRRVLLTVFVVT